MSKSQDYDVGISFALEEIAKKKAERAEAIAAFESVLSNQRQQLDRLMVAEEELKRIQEKIPAQVDGGPFHKLEAKEALTRYLAEGPGTDLQTIRKALVDGGFQSKAKRPEDVLRITLTRMKDSGMAKEVDGLWWLIPPESASAPEAESTAEESDNQPYAGMLQRTAVVAFLKTNQGSFFTPSEIAKALQAGGVKTTAKRFATSISALLGRLDKRWGIQKNSDGAWGFVAEGANPSYSPELALDR